MELNVFLFDDEAAVNAAVDTINNAIGIPKQNGITDTYAAPQQDPTSGKWYILADAVTRQYCTGEQVLSIPDPPFPVV